MPIDRFSVYNLNGTLINPDLAHPWHHEHTPIWLTSLISVMVPGLVYLLMSLRVRSFWDSNNAVCKDHLIRTPQREKIHLNAWALYY